MPRVKLKTAAGLPVANHGLRLLPVYHPSYILRLNGVRDAEVEHRWHKSIETFSLLVRGAMSIDDVWAGHHYCLYCKKMRVDGRRTCKTHHASFRLDQIWKEAHVQEALL